MGGTALGPQYIPTHIRVALKDQIGVLYVTGDCATDTALNNLPIHSHSNYGGSTRRTPEMNLSQKTFKMKETCSVSYACQTM